MMSISILQNNTTESVVNIHTILPSESMPNLTISKDRKEELIALLHKKGAILFRDFNIDTGEKFKSIADIFITDFISDNGEHNPLPESNGVFTPVAYSAKEKLFWHNENSFNQIWPLIIQFGAAQPAESGGETPIVDSRYVLDTLNSEIVSEFKAKGVVYTRTHGFGFGRSWQETYRIENKDILEKKLKAQNIQYEWVEKDRLITKQYRPAIVEHPITHELAWFNQAQHWHPYCLQAGVRESLLQLFPEAYLPRNCHFGDGTIIPDAVMQHILDVYERLEMTFPWQKGDVMVLDNILFAHARNPYVGERKLFVTMGKRAMFLDTVNASSQLCAKTD